MKQSVLLLIFILLTSTLSAQISKSVECNAGSLSILLTSEEKSTITNLTLTGAIDARDFKTMRDSMPVISILDMTNTNIVAYTGILGTTSTSTCTYPENTVPANAFDKNPFKTSLTTVFLPNSTTSIGRNAFTRCFGLKSINIPSLLTSIGHKAFIMCDELTSITIPSSVTYIESSAFARSSGDVTVSLSNPNYCSVNGVLFNKDTTNLIHCPASKTVSYTIPSSVTTISNYAFADCWNFNSITIPNSVTSIENDAFFQCWNLTSIVLPPNITSLSANLFNHCRGLTSIVIPPSVTSIGYASFSDCQGLTSITIPSSVKDIGSLAFNFCLDMTSIYVESPIPVDLRSKTDVFDDINKSSCKLYVPYLTKELYENEDQWTDFYNIIEMNGFYLPDTRADLSYNDASIDSIPILSNVSWSVVNDQEWLTLNMLDGVGDKTLIFTANANTNLNDRTAKITISATNVPSQTIDVIQYGVPKTYIVSAGGLCDSLTSNEKNTISNMKLEGTINARDFKTLRDSMPALSIIDLSEATIESYTGTLGTSGTNSAIYPSNVIPEYAFYNPIDLVGKSSLRLFTIPNTVSSIGDDAFRGCSGLIRFSLTSSVTSIGNHSFQGCENLSSFYLSSSVEHIGNYTFYECSLIKNITLPHSLSTIGNSAFSKCVGLTSILIPTLVNTIGYSAFNGCSSLNSATISSSITSLSSGLFYGCGDLSSFTIPSSVTSIKSNAFSYCSSLTSFTIPFTVETIETDAFSYCTGLTYISIPSSITSLGAYAFRDCDHLYSVKLPSSITEINDYTFYNCSRLTSVNIPSSITRIGRNAFRNILISTIEIPSSVKTIESYAFGSCDRLTSISIPISVTTIGEYAFWWCTSLPAITIPKTVTRFEDGLFSWDHNLTSITIPSTITHIGNSCFYNCYNLDYIKCDIATPINLVNSSGVFSGVHKTTCILYVPLGSSGLYEIANQWEDFSTIIEIPGFMLSSNQATLESSGESTESIELLSYTSWTASSDQSWLTLNTYDGDNDAILTFTATANPYGAIRTAEVTISAEGFDSQTIAITQEAGNGPIIPQYLEVTDTIVKISETPCFNATQNIIVANNVNPVQIKTGASATFIAGHSITFSPGFHAQRGSSVSAYISTEGVYCDQSPENLAQYNTVIKSSEIKQDEEIAEENDVLTSVKIYPNPNQGFFKVQLEGYTNAVEVSVINMLGAIVYNTYSQQSNLFEIDLSDKTRGIYLVRISDGKTNILKKVIIQ